MQSIKSIQNGYIGKEKDVENGLGDHTSTTLSAGYVRKYDGIRFNSIDPLYYGWTPYQYSGNKIN